MLKIPTGSYQEVCVLRNFTLYLIVCDLSDLSSTGIIPAPCTYTVEFSVGKQAPVNLESPFSTFTQQSLYDQIKKACHPSFSFIQVSRHVCFPWACPYKA